VFDDVIILLVSFVIVPEDRLEGVIRKCLGLILF
jgi:hypothetical protein